MTEAADVTTVHGVLVVGLGSMGKRRVRNLQALGVARIGGTDARADRRVEAQEKYGIQTFGSLGEALAAGFDAAVVSVPPDAHSTIALACVRHGLPVFIEASVVDEGLAELAALAEARGLCVFPSPTMRYFPGPRAIRASVASQSWGRPLHYVYHSGQYLPDWHPWESISEFYVSKRATGGCREIVPFELAWLVHAFGDVTAVRGTLRQTGVLDAEIDDLYTAHLEHASGVTGVLVVDVLARRATRDFRLVCDAGTLHWDGVGGVLRAAAAAGEWVVQPLEVGHPEAGYVYPEEPYIDEIRDYLRCVGGAEVPYTMADDRRVLRTLYAIEESARSGRRVEVR